MKRLVLVLTMLVAGYSASASAATKIRIVAPWRALQYQGAVVAVRGKAEIGHGELQGTEVRLRGADGRLQFLGFVPKLNEGSFPDLNALDGREVVMYGVIEKFRAVGATQLLYRDQLRTWPLPKRG
jgi:hypothetical protein